MTQITPDTLPDFHFLLVAPNLEPDWLFRGALAYWERFSPTILSSGELLAVIPPDQTVAVSILTRRDAFETMAVEVFRNRDDAYVDALIYDTVREAAAALDARAIAYQPFGVPLAPTAIPPTRVPLTPSPGAIVGGTPQPTPNTSGFITQVPTAPSGFITQTPSSTPRPSEDNGAPIDPTPGSIIGD
ncbi:MAG: hypothetical protein AAF125_25630 [Chloroflexota bacterium]